MPSVSILIATSARLSSLRETLHSLCKVQIPDDFSVEVILVENGSRSGIELLLSTLPQSSFSVRYFFEPLAGKSRALNFAISQTRSEILLFTDDDVRFPCEWIVQMCAPLISGEGSVVVGGCRLAPHLERKWMTRYHRGLLASTEYLSDSDPSEFAGVNMACLREVFSRVPQFDCELGGGGLGNCEDCLLARQLKQAGYVFVSRTNMWVEHHPSASRLFYGSWIRAATSYGRSLAYLSHHWYHEKIRFVRIQLLYFLLKLHLRLLFSRRRSLENEGIPPWELSYRIDIAKLQHYLYESNRVKNYSLLGLKKLNVGSHGAIV
jgi:glycosyltransferase involved in cell wall biosynthesis